LNATPAEVLALATTGALSTPDTVIQINHISSHFQPLKIDTSLVPPQDLLTDLECANRRLPSTGAVPNLFQHYPALELWNGDGRSHQAEFLVQRIGIWMNHLNQGLRTTFIADTDSHTFTNLNTAGARTWTASPTDAPAAIELERWAASATSWWAGLEDARVVGLGHLAIGLTASAIGRPVGLTSPTGEDLGAPVARRLTMILTAAYGVTETVELDVAIPIAFQSGDRRAALGDDRALASTAGGDLRIGGKLQVVDRGALRVGFAADLVLPTGNEQHYTGEASWIVHWRALAGVQLGRFGAAAAAGVRLRGEEVLLAPEQVAGNEVVGGIALAYALPPIGGMSCDWTQLRLIAELDAVLGDTVGEVRGPSPVEARLGVRGRIWRGWTIGVVAGRGVNDEVGSPRWRGVVELSWRDQPRSDEPVAPRVDDVPDDDELEP
jgi:hypothetical protein